MNVQFKVGDLVIMQNAGYYSDYNGCLAVVTGDCQSVFALDLSMMKYAIRLAYNVNILAAGPGEIFAVCAEPHQIRHLKKDSEEDQLQAEKRIEENI